jgi:hypothetical protein
MEINNVHNSTTIDFVPENVNRKESIEILTGGIQ